MCNNCYHQQQSLPDIDGINWLVAIPFIVGPIVAILMLICGF